MALLIGLTALVLIGGTFAVIQKMNIIVEEKQAVAAETAETGENPESLKAGNFRIGDQMPDVTLHMADGASFSLKEKMDPEHFTVVTFTHPDCPCAANCSRLINEMMDGGYDDVKVVGILSHGYGDPRVVQALQEQKDEGLVRYPVYMDPDHSALKTFGAERTPEMWIADKEGVIRFWGAPENTLFPGSEGHRFLLREAIDALRNGETPEIQTYKPIGCPIEL